MSVDVLTPTLTDNWDQPEAWKIANYVAQGGYQAARKAVGMDPDAIITLVKDSGLRGRGGAGFPTGVKWSFIPQTNPKPKYLVINCDESEPGTCKDMPMLMATPHTLVEGVIISSYAVRAHHAFFYVRGEVLQILPLSSLLGWPQEREPQYGVLMQAAELSFILAIDSFAGREDAVIKSLDDFRPKGVAGVTTLSNGQIVLILDMKELLGAPGENRGVSRASLMRKVEALALS